MCGLASASPVYTQAEAACEQTAMFVMSLLSQASEEVTMHVKYTAIQIWQIILKHGEVVKEISAAVCIL